MANWMDPEPKRRKDRPKKLRDMTKASQWAVVEPPNKDELKVARVYVNYGIESGVNLDGEFIRLGNRRRMATVAGDLVYTDGRTVEGILPRGKVLTRYADKGGVHLMAAHLDQVGLVASASLPPLHEGFVDRYLVYCRIVDLPLFIVLNKIDEEQGDIRERLRPFEEAGVDIYPVSATEGDGMEDLCERLVRGITVLSGLSGVGKSTLINTLLDEDIPTREVSHATKKGRHTTTAIEAYDLADTLIIDTPGIKKFGFLGISRSQVIKGFPEMQPFAGDCRFEDCQHYKEKGCAVKDAVKEGRIDERRYHAYVEMLKTIAEED